MALGVFGMQDPALQAACFRAYNDWLADFCAGAPKRLHGVALIPMYDAAEAVAELKRAPSAWACPAPPSGARRPKS